MALQLSPPNCPSPPVDGTNVELRCNECGAVVGVIQVDIPQGTARAGVRDGHMPALRQGEHVSPASRRYRHTCGAECGEAVGATGPERELEWVEIHDDTCTWYEFDYGAGADCRDALQTAAAAIPM